jgi:hypothetical protein
LTYDTVGETFFYEGTLIFAYEEIFLFLANEICIFYTVILISLALAI